MQPTVLLLLVATLLLLLDAAHADCEPGTCGNLTVKHPFWLRGANQTSPPCGDPAFQVWCTGGGGVASLGGSALHVLSIDYDNNSFVAAHSRIADGADGVCRTDFNVSVSIRLSPFTISSRNRVLCFLYGCNGTEPRGRGYANATSGCGSPIYAYLGGSYDWDAPPAIPTGGCKYACFPVLVGPEAAANYRRLLRDGFLLEWQTVGVGDCPACVAAGGQCRYDTAAAAAFACLCPDGKLRAAASTCAGESLLSDLTQPNYPTYSLVTAPQVRACVDASRAAGQNGACI